MEIAILVILIGIAIMLGKILVLLDERLPND